MAVIFQAHPVLQCYLKLLKLQLFKYEVLCPKLSAPGA